MRTMRTFGATAMVIALGMLASCASTELAYYPIEGETMRLVIRVAPDARVQADYFVTIDPDDPVETIISVGTSIAKANQVARAQEKMDHALRHLDLSGILDSEIGSYFEEIMEMRLTDRRADATYYLSVEVREYGIEASGPGSSVEFVVRGYAELVDNVSGDRIWRDHFSAREQVSPSLFGLPAAAGNVLSAAMLSELTEDQIADGMERVTRNAAWEVGQEFEDDLYRARRRR